MCASIEVTGELDTESSTGTYFLSEEKYYNSPERPTYKLNGKNSIIFYRPDDKGWCIGKYEALKTGNYFYTSKTFLKKYLQMRAKQTARLLPYGVK